MVTGAEIYWITRLDAIKELFEALAVIFGVLGTLGVVAYIVSQCVWKVDGDEGAEKFCKAIRPTSIVMVIVFVLSLTINVALPTMKEFCAIKFIPPIINNEEVQGIPKELAGLAKDWIGELKPKKTEQP